MTFPLLLHKADAPPQHPAMIRAVKDLKAQGKTTFLCLSNENEVFIKTILKVRTCFPYEGTSLKAHNRAKALKTSSMRSSLTVPNGTKAVS